MSEYNSTEVYNLRRQRRRRKAARKRAVALFLTLALAAAAVFGAVKATGAVIAAIKREQPSGVIGKKLSKRVKTALELEIPDWIDSQIIHKHTTARTGTRLTDIKDIVIHYVGNPGSTAQNNRDYFDKPSTTVSSHFVVGLDGEVIQCIPLYEKSAASNERNKDTISIEVCHPDDSGEFNEATYQSLIRLTVWLCGELGLDENDIIRHYDITGKICPKYYVENPEKWDSFKDDVKEGLKNYGKD